MERFVRPIVGGGVAVVAGLWITELAGAWSSPWLLGLALAVIGTAVLFAGTGSKLRF